MYPLLNFKVLESLEFRLSLHLVVKLCCVIFIQRDSLHNSQTDMYMLLLFTHWRPAALCVWRHPTVKHLARANQTLSSWHHHPNRLRRFGRIGWHVIFFDAIPNEIIRIQLRILAITRKTRSRCRTVLFNTRRRRLNGCRTFQCQVSSKIL